MKIPDINDFSWDGDGNLAGNYDASYAWKHFGGKTKAEAHGLFAEHFRCYSEDLLWMGRSAFEYYFPVAVDYLLEEGAALNDLDPYGRLLLHSVSHQYRDSELPTAVSESAARLKSLLDKWGVENEEESLH